MCVPSHFVCLSNVHFYSLFSVAKSEHSDLKGWADGIQSGAERDDLPHTVVLNMKWSEMMEFSVCFAICKCLPGTPFETLGGKAHYECKTPFWWIGNVKNCYWYDPVQLFSKQNHPSRLVVI